MTDASRDYNAALQEVRVVRAENDILHAASGRQYIDVLTGGGTTLLGHAHPAVTEAVVAQSTKFWITSTLPSSPAIEARAAIESFFGDDYRVACMYSTGMEAAEFALRVARVSTGRRGMLGFESCMHGKSTAAAYLGWPNELVSLPDFARLPYLSTRTEDEVLSELERALAGRQIAAVFFEPVAGSGGGHVASARFAAGIANLAAEHGTLLVCDEIFTGFFRTGPALLHRELGLSPDIVLAGKTMGNGFPVSVAVVKADRPIVPAMLPNSTYSGHALASSAVVATLAQMRKLDMGAKISSIERIVRSTLGPLTERGIALRGKGALWVLEFEAPAMASLAGVRILDGGVVASVAGRCVRVLPAATIAPAHLQNACEVVLQACTEALDAQRDAG